MKHHIAILIAAGALALFPFGCATHSNNNTTPPSVADAQSMVSASHSAPATAASPSLFAKVKAWWSGPSPAVAALRAETSGLLKTAVFAAGKDRIAGANWADSAAAGIYAARDQIAADPSQLNLLLGTFLPVDATWTPVIDSLVVKLLCGQLNTASDRRAALDAIAQTLNATAAAQRANQSQ